jgi:hypothetical protein
MRMPRVRFTVRGMMLAVAIAGLACSGEAMRRNYEITETIRIRRPGHEWRAEFHRDEAREARLRYEKAETHLARRIATRKFYGDPSSAAEWDERLRASVDRSIRDLEDVRESSKRAAEWHERLRAKYERAARSPWLPVEPDPPAPK